MIADLHLSAIQDETIREQMRELLNLVEKLWADLQALKEENQPQ